MAANVLLDDDLPPEPAEDEPITVEPATTGEAASDDRSPKSYGEFIAAFWPEWKLMRAMMKNLERERNLPEERWTYRCLGEVPDGAGGVKVCGALMQAKRPEYRSYDERLICPNEAHRGELTPMEPIRQ